jgi:hypothetical protein
VDESNLLRFGPERMREPNGRGVYKAEIFFDRVLFSRKNGQVISKFAF